MTMNFGGMGPMGMMGMMGMMPMNGMSSGNVPQYYTAKYGCEDCFRKQPYWAEYPKPVNYESKIILKPSIFRRIWNNIVGG